MQDLTAEAALRAFREVEAEWEALREIDKPESRIRHFIADVESARRGAGAKSGRSGTRWSALQALGEKERIRLGRVYCRRRLWPVEAYFRERQLASAIDAAAVLHFVRSEVGMSWHNLLRSRHHSAARARGEYCWLCAELGISGQDAGAELRRSREYVFLCLARIRRKAKCSRRLARRLEGLKSKLCSLF